MEVVILGSGTAVPEPDRFPAGYLVRGDDVPLTLVDLGPGVLRRFAQAGESLADLDLVLLTHYHTDHCADLTALLFALRNPGFAGRKRLRLRGHAGLRTLLERIEAAWPWCRQGDYELDVEEIGPGPHEIEGLRVEAARIEHTAASLGYRITDPSGAVAAFSGDATYCDGLIATARAADFFVCDAAFPTAEPGEGHMTPTEAGRAAAAADARTLCLTHFYPACHGHDLAAEARTQFDGRVVLATDLWTYDLRDGTYSALTS